VTALNGLVEGTPYAAMKLEEIVHKTHAGPKKISTMPARCGTTISIGAACRLKPPRPKAIWPAPSSAIRLRRETDRGARRRGKKPQFGSGWAWLVSIAGKLSVVNTPNAESPMAQGVNCLLTVDVWEHAYYLDYQNERPRYLETVAGEICLNWSFAARTLSKGKPPGPQRHGITH